MRRIDSAAAALGQAPTQQTGNFLRGCKALAGGLSLEFRDHKCRVNQPANNTPTTTTPAPDKRPAVRNLFPGFGCGSEGVADGDSRALTSAPVLLLLLV